MEYLRSEFIVSAYSPHQMPSDGLVEIAFAGRSNVGKSSLLNTVLNRKNLVKVSARPGKTQALNFFRIDDACYFVDLPGYGFAKVSKGLKAEWEKLVTAYLLNRTELTCVVVIIDLRHAAKALDTELINLLRQNHIPFIAVYTKADKLSGNQRAKNARLLDAGHGIERGERIIFSAKNRSGREQLMQQLGGYIEII